MKVTIAPEGSLKQNGSSVVVTGTKTQAESIIFFDENGREDMYFWARARDKKTLKRRRSIQLYLCNKQILKTFFSGVSFIVIINIILTIICTFLCSYYDISLRYQAMMFVTPLIFPLSFLINSDYRRRERALIYMAQIRSSINSFLHFGKEFGILLDKNMEFSHLKNELEHIMFHISAYLSCHQYSTRKHFAKAVYEDFSDLSHIIQQFAMNDMSKPGVVHSVTNLLRIHRLLISSFERIRCIRDYRTPISTRAFTKITSFMAPILLAPLYISFAKQVPESERWSPFIFAFFVSFLLSHLQSVQDILYDPFTGLTKDAIKIHELDEWIKHSLSCTENRLYKMEDNTIPDHQNRREREILEMTNSCF